MSEYWSGQRVLITGGAGFIGSNLAIRLVRLGAEVLIVDSMLPAYGARLENLAEVRQQVRINFSDVRDSFSLRYLVQDQDVIFSLAGQVSHSESMRDPDTDLDINCRSQLSLLECCRHFNSEARLVFASTRQIFGRPVYLPVDERHPMRPVDVNGINKLAAEMYYTLYHRVYDIPTVSLRLTNTYGPRMDLSAKKGFIGVFIRRAIQGQTIEVFGSGDQRRDFNFVDDVVEALLLAGSREGLEGEVYNLGHPRSYSLLEFVEILGKLASFDWRLTPFPEAARRIDIGDYQGDFREFAQATGWSPRVELQAGLETTLDYYRSLDSK